MFARAAVRLVVFLLQKADLSMEQRNLLTAAVLDKMGALPFRDIIVVNEEGNLLVNGRKLDLETARALRESAGNVLNSNAFRFIREQVLFNAVTLGVHKVETERQMFFARAAIWWGQEEDKLLRLLAQNEGGLD